MSKSISTLTLFAMLASLCCHTSAQAAVITTPGLVAVRFWEATGPVTPYTFAFNGPQMTNQIGVGTLGPNINDYSGAPIENYDVFYSDANGAFNVNGNYVTVEAVYPLGLPAGGGLNLGAVDLVFGSGTLRADVLSSWSGLGGNFVAGSIFNSVDADTAIPSTFTTMGSTTIPPTQHLRVTVTWSKLPIVPEPATGMLITTAMSSVLLMRRRCR